MPEKTLFNNKSLKTLLGHPLWSDSSIYCNFNLRHGPVQKLRLDPTIVVVLTPITLYVAPIIEKLLLHAVHAVVGRKKPTHSSTVVSLVEPFQDRSHE